MKSVLFAGAFLFVLIGIVSFVRTRFKTQPETEPGFRELVKDPDELFEEFVIESQLSGSNVADFESWGEGKIHEQVVRFVLGEDQSRELRLALQSLVPTTHQSLLKILQGDPGELDAESIGRLLELFDPIIPAEAIPVLKPYLTHESESVRKACVLAVAESTWPSALPAIVRGLQDTNESVRSYALLGLIRVADSEQMTNEVASGIVPDLERLIRRDQNVNDATWLLAKVDPQRAASLLVSEEVLQAENKHLFQILRTINAFDIAISRERVIALINDYSQREMSYPNDYTLGESLALLGRFKIEEDKATLQEYSNHPNEEVASGAAEGLVAAHDLGDFRNRIWDKEKLGGSLSKEQQLYVAVRTMDSEINNGGHSQYFFNSSGNDWPLALEGLRAMGFKERLKVFEEALNLFGEEGPFTDRRKRSQQLANVYSKHETKFDELDGRYYKSNETIEVLTLRYVIQNAEQFK